MAYPGGKESDGVYQRIINEIPPHGTYIEPFLGGGAIMRLKLAASRSLGVDKDPAAAAQFLSGWLSARLEPDLNTLLAQPDQLFCCGRLVVGVGCALDVLRSYPFTGDEFVYLDPPYLGSTRRSQARIYREEFMAEPQHEALLTLACSLPCPVAISGYASDLYARRLKGWRCVTFWAGTRAGTAALEHLWCNYPEPAELHDYRYLGTDKTDRQRIKRKKERWLGKLRGMPTQERHAILAALESWKAEQARSVVNITHPGQLTGN